MKYDPIEEEKRWYFKGKSGKGESRPLPLRHHFAHNHVRSKLYDTLVDLGCHRTSSVLEIGCGSGEDTRDFTFVDDIVDGTLRLGVTPEAVGDAFNLASETETRVIDIANIVNEITGNHNGVEFVARRDWDKITRRKASIEKAKMIRAMSP